ncbi:MAG: glycerophosphodiester phosphodiesterase [candidate division NC10 bacterium]|nr:glycerophosphodiester phosphodiesterase [candidate division NC10 bacterium]
MKPLWEILGIVCILVAHPALALDLQGHRGARGLAPENTLSAFATALSLGVTTLELDTGITKDGVVVISHNTTLNPDITRDSAGTWLGGPGPAIHALTFPELQQYDVGRIKPGTDYAKQFPEQQAVDGTRIPRLADLFALVKQSGNEQVRFNIETKISPLEPGLAPHPETFATTLVDLIRQEGMAPRVTIQSFGWRTLQSVQRIAPEMPTVYLSVQQRFFDNIGADKNADSLWTAGFQYKDYRSVVKMVKAAGGTIWSPFVGDVTKFKVKEAHALGIRVVVWTVNEAPQIGTLLDLGVDGIISDRPDVARQVLEKRGLALPPATPVTP